jgi:chromosome partitioning protein
MLSVAIANQKGGTGKTTTAVSLAHRFALDGYRVLLVDIDVQGHVAVALGLEKQPGVYQAVQWFQGMGNLLIVKARERLDILPSDKATEPAKRILAGLDFRERILEEVLNKVRDKYDIAFVDCAPSVDVLHVAALVATDYILVPTRLDHLAIDGVSEVIASLAEVRRKSGKGATLLGIIPTFLDRQTNETVFQLQALAKRFGKLVLPPVPVDTRLRECPAYGRTIWEYAPTSRSVTGIVNGSGKPVGGYLQIVEKVREALR